MGLFSWRWKAFTVSERVAIAEAIEEELRGRNLATLKQNAEVENFPQRETPEGKTRDLAASKAGLGSGKTLEAAQAVIAEAVAERLQGRQLANLVQNRSGNISGSGEQGETRDLAAAKAGLGSGKTLEAAQ